MPISRRLSDNGTEVLWAEAQSITDLKARLTPTPAPRCHFRATARSRDARRFLRGLEQIACRPSLRERPRRSPGLRRAENNLRARRTRRRFPRPPRFAAREKRDASVEQLRRKVRAKARKRWMIASGAPRNASRARNPSCPIRKLQTALLHWRLYSRRFHGAKGAVRHAISIAPRSRTRGYARGSRKRRRGSRGRESRRCAAAARRSPAPVRRRRQRTRERAGCRRGKLAQSRVSPRKSDIAVGEVALVWVPSQE